MTGLDDVTVAGYLGVSVDVVAELRAVKDASPVLTVAKVQDVVARHYGLDHRDMISARRGWGVAHPRQLAMYLAYRLTNKSLPDLGRRFGDRDHTTVLYGVSQVKRRIASDPEFAQTVEELRERLVSGDKSPFPIGGSGAVESLNYPMEQSKITEAA